VNLSRFDVHRRFHDEPRSLTPAERLAAKEILIPTPGLLESKLAVESRCPCDRLGTGFRM
jgi:hypothetical protein